MNSRIPSQEISRDILEMKFRRYCCASICPNVLAIISVKELKRLIALSLYNSKMKFEHAEQRQVMTVCARESGLALSTMEKWFYQKKIA